MNAKKLNIVIYSNCAGNVIKTMFKNHTFTKDKFNISYFTNYENLDKTKIENNHKLLLENCDIFIYQPMNKNNNYSEYNINNIKEIFKKECKIIRVNYYRTRAFWYECNYIPYNSCGKYSFHTHIGLYKDFVNLKNINSKEDIVNFTNNIKIDNETIIKFCESEIEKIKILDDKSDVKMYDFFKLNYKDHLLFYDCFHPTNIFFYEIFRQLVKQICNYQLPEKDYDFLNNKNINDTEMTNWTVPILPLIKQILNLKYKDIIPCFHPQCHPKKLNMDVYDNYYIRLSPINLKKYLKNV